MSIEAMKRNIEAQLDEYEAAILAYDRWMADWRRRNPPRFRAQAKPPNDAAAAVAEEAG